ncbi:DUF535 family protein [Methylocystis heyeri]|uniref:DUF535 domain-containing protein n=1 Tax=Methylocystis heyeri TaxID=391905 RepID=A0A6B8KED5_9HYPH|nr:DUF535 family protein [Methylocystis heyeri]QGM45982.1 DUF535 domain-containing protein [Methylocystis heyeri]
MPPGAKTRLIGASIGTRLIISSRVLLKFLDYIAGLRGVGSFAEKRASLSGVVMSEFVAREPAQLYPHIFGAHSDSTALKDILTEYFIGSPTLRNVERQLAQRHDLIDSLLTAHRVHRHNFDEMAYLCSTLSRGSRPVRVDCFYRNYAFLLTVFSPSNFARMANGEVPLFEHSHGDHVYRIVLALAPSARHEGEIALLFKRDNDPLYLVSFNIVPGHALGLQAERAILLSRMQGMKGMFPQIRQATKDFKEVSPQAALVAALDGFAQSLGLEHIAGASATNLFCYREERSESLHHGYDRFFASLGARGPVDGFFHLDAPIPQKRLNLVKQGHRLRTKAKHKLKHGIAEAVRASVQATLRMEDAAAMQERAAQIMFFDLLLSNGRLAEELASRERQAEELSFQKRLADEELLQSRNRLAEEQRRFAECNGDLAQKLRRFEEENQNLRATANLLEADLDKMRARPSGFRKIIADCNIPLLKHIGEKAEINRLIQAGFDDDFYLRHYPDVKAAGDLPARHYVRHGRREGRIARFSPRGQNAWSAFCEV